MATGAYSVGYNIGAKVDYSQIREANKAAGELVKNLDRIKSMQGGSSASGNMGKQYAEATGESAKLERQNKDTAASQQKLNDQMKVTVNTGKGLKSVANNTRQVGDYSRSAAGDVEKLSNSAKKIKSSNTSIKQTSDNISKLGDHSQTAAKKLDRLNETGKKFKSAGYSMLPVSAALGASFLKGAKDATKLQHEYTILKNLIKTGGESTAASVKNTNKMMSDGRKYSLKYGQSQQDIAKGYEVLVRRGYTSGQALAAQKSYMQASIASGDAYSDVINNGAAAVEQFGLRSKDMATMTKNSRTALNQMAYAADLTATSFSDLGEAMKYAGPQAHSANQSLSSTASAIGMLSNYGVDGSTAGTSMRQIYQHLIKMPEKGAAADAMDTLNLSNKDFRDSKNNLLPLVDIFDKLNSRMKGMSSTQKGGIYSALFGTYGSTAGNIIGSHTKALRELNVEVAKSQKQGNGKGYIAGLSDKNMKSWQNQLKLLKSSVEDLGMSFARDVLPTVTPMVKQLNKMVQSFGRLPKPMKQTIAYGTALLGVAGPLAIAIGGVASAASTMGKGFALLNGTKTVAKTAETATSSSTTSGAVGTAAKGGMSLLGKVAVAGVGIDIGASAVKAFSDGIDTKKGGSELWNTAGKAVGGGAGLIIGGPAGAVIGEQIGSGFTKVVKATDFTKHQKGATSAKNNRTNAYKKVDKYNTPQLHEQGGASWQGTAAIAGEVAGINSSDGASKRRKPKKATNPLDSLPKSAKQATESALEYVKKANSGWIKTDYDYLVQSNKYSAKRQASLNADYAKQSSTYSKLEKGLSQYVAKQEAGNSKAVSYLKKNRLISGSAAQKAVSSESKWGSKRVATVQSDIAKIVADEKNGGKNRDALIAKLNADIVKTTSKGSKKQRQIYQQLQNNTGKLSYKQYTSVMKSSKKAEAAVVASARKQYNGQVSKAQATYDKTVKYAAKVYGVHSKQYSRIVKKATKQYIKTTNSAESQYEKTKYWAEKQRAAVVKKAKQQASEVEKAFETGAQNIANSIPALLKVNANAGLYSHQKPKSNTQAIKDYVHPGKTLSSHSTLATANGSKPKKIGSGGYFTGKASGTAGALKKTQHAMVNEAGTEIAYNPKTAKFRFLGKGPTLAKLYAGEHIINARDTKKILSGGLGVGRTLPGYAAGTGLSTSATSTADKVAKNTSKSSTKMKKKTVGDYTSMQKGATKQLTKLNSNNSSKWKSIGSQTGKRTNKLRKDTVNDFDSMQKGTQKQMNQLQSGVVASAKDTAVGFGKQMNRMKGYAHTAMGGAVGQLNRGITGIDSVLGQFGGNSSVIKPIKYAAGSNGAIAENQIAMVNDANSGPRQEAIQRGNHFILPKGNNRILPLQKGDRVLNGRQTEMLGLNRYANGSGISNSTLSKLIDSSHAHPQKQFNSAYVSKITAAGANLQKGATKLAEAASKSKGYPWNTEVWQQMSDAKSGAAGGAIAHSPGSGWSVSSGFGYRGQTSGGYSQHDGVDYDGAKVVHAMNTGKVTHAGGAPSGWGGGDGIGESVVVGGGGLNYIYQELNGKNNSGAKLLVGVGDSVSAGQAIAVLGPSGTHVHVGATHHPMFSIGGSSTAGWLDPRTVKSTAVKSKKTNSALSKLVKSEIGSQLKFVSKNLSEDDVNGISGSISGSQASRAKQLVAMLKKAYPSATNHGAAAIVGNWMLESGLNPGIQNSIGASGLGQWYKGRFTALQNYAKKHGKSWKDAGTQISFALNADGSRGIFRSVLGGSGSVASLAKRFSDQWEVGGYTAQHVADAVKVASMLNLNASGGWAKKGKINIFGEPGVKSEVAINPAQPAADSLINQTIQARAKAEPSSPSADFLSTVKSAKVPSTKQSIKPQITININGDISDERMLKKTQDMIERALAKSFKQIDDEYGLDESIY